MATEERTVICLCGHHWPLVEGTTFECVCGVRKLEFAAPTLQRFPDEPVVIAVALDALEEATQRSRIHNGVLFIPEGMVIEGVVAGTIRRVRRRRLRDLWKAARL